MMVYAYLIIIFVILLITRIEYSLSTFAIFPTRDGSAAYGIFGALAVPLDLPHRNVFVSYNFEANYNLPYVASNIIPGPLQKFEGFENDLFPQEGRNEKDSQLPVLSNDTVADVDVTTEINESAEVDAVTEVVTRKRRSLISRRSFYKILHDKLKFAGFKGKPCILKLICETNAYNLGEYNGILGHLFHVVFSPSSSVSENLPLDYYKAEQNGVASKCNLYDKICPQSIFDIITVPINEIINVMKS